MKASPFFLRVPEVVLKLLVQPAFRAGIKRDREADRHLRANTGAPVQDAGQRLAAYAERLRGVGDSQVQGFQAQRRALHPDAADYASS